MSEPNYGLFDLTTTSGGEDTGHESVINGDRDGSLGVWSDASANSQPVSLIVTFSKPRAIGRIAVHTPLDGLVEEGNVEARVNGQWQTLFGIPENEETIIERTFTPVLADAVKVNVTKHDGPAAKIAEVEVYAR